MRRLTELFATMIDLVLPQWCAGCAHVPGLLCTGCRTRLTATPRQIPPRPSVGRLPPLWATTSYEGPIRSALLAYKERGRHSLATPLGVALARALTAATDHGTIPPGPVTLVPIPTSSARLHERGYDPLALLVHEAARATRAEATHPVPVAASARDPAPVSRPAPAAEVVVVPALGHVRAVADQAGLDARGRAANLAGALEIRPRLRAKLDGMAVVLVDDVLTTGATLAEAARALSSAGVQVCASVVLAVTPRSR